MERVSLLTGVNNQDYDYTALHLALMDSITFSGLAVSYSAPNISITAGKAFVKCTKTSGKVQIVVFESDATKVISSGFTLPCKVWIEINQANLDAVTGNSPAGTGIGLIKAGAAYPAGNYCPLASISGGGAVTDDREVTEKMKDKLSVKYNKLGGATAIGTDAYKITLTDITSYAQLARQLVMVEIDVANTGIATLEINALGAKNIVKYGGDLLITGDIPANSIAVFAWNNTQNRFEYLNSINQAALLDSSALTEENFIVGQAVSSGENLYATSAPTFAESTYIQKIGNVTKNKRVSYVEYGSGNASNQVKASLKKFVTPGVDLKLRIETDDGTGKPSGTLAHANATATILTSGLTTSLVDTTVTLAGSVTIAKGTRVHMVWYAGTLGSETVHASNYFGIGCRADGLTTARPSYVWDGSAWNTNYHTDSSNQTWSMDASSGNSYGFIITANYNGAIIKVGRAAGCTGTRCRIRTAGAVLMDTSTTIVNEEFIFSGASTAIVAGTNYIVEIDASGAGFALPYVASYVAASGLGLMVSFIQGTQNTGGQPNAYNIESITAVAQADMPYSSSALFESVVLGLTNANYPRSLPTDLTRVAKESKAAGNTIKSTIYGENSSQTGLVPYAFNKLPLWLSNTPGAMSTTPGAYKYMVGRPTAATKVFVDGYNYSTFKYPIPASNAAVQNTTGRSIELLVDGGTVSAIQTSTDGVTYRTLQSATAKTVILQPLDYFKITRSVTPTAVTGRYI